MEFYDARYNVINMTSIFTLFVVILLGLGAGWLVNYLADVLPNRRALTQPFCLSCNATLGIKEHLLLLPCPQCQKRPTWRAALVLILAPFISLAIWFFPLFPPLNYPLALLILTYFGVVAVIDMEHRLILHVVSVVGAVLFLGIGTYINGIPQGSLLLGLRSSLVGGAVGFGVFLVFYLLGMLVARARARRLGTDDGEEAFGFGDVNLAGVLGLLIGWPYVLQGLVLGVLLAGAFIVLMMIWLLATRKFDAFNTFIAYGPFLLLGAVIVLFFPYWLMMR